MVLGMSLATFTMVHVIISLIGIVAGLIVMFGMLGSNRMPGLTAIFLLFTILTSATGFLFPFTQLLPSHMIGILSLVLLAIACIALYAMKLAGPVALDLCGDGAGLAVFQRVRAGDPELPEDTGAARAGAGQSADRTGVRGGAGHRAGVLRARDHRRVAAIPARGGVRLNQVRGFDRKPKVRCRRMHRLRNGRSCAMPTIKTKDGVEIYYKDWGKGQPIVFSHGWPLSADDWDAQMLFFLNHGYRVIAHDRRGHGRSTQIGDGHDMDHYADDLAAVTAHLDLKNAIHVGHSTGGGEVVHYLARHGESRVAKAAIISAVPPLMVQDDGQSRRSAQGSL